MKKILILLVFSFLTGGAFAQPRKGKGYNKERIEKLRSKFIGEKLELNKDEADKFWPIYNQYRVELDAIQDAHDDFHHSKTSIDHIKSLSEEKAKRCVENQMEKERKHVEIRQKYFKEFKKALPIKKVAIFFQAEIEFRKKLFKRLSKRRKEDKRSQKNKHSE
jgi:hypothetical protein